MPIHTALWGARRTGRESKLNPRSQPGHVESHSATVTLCSHSCMHAVCILQCLGGALHRQGSLAGTGRHVTMPRVNAIDWADGTTLKSCRAHYRCTAATEVRYCACVRPHDGACTSRAEPWPARSPTRVAMATRRRLANRLSWDLTVGKLKKSQIPRLVTGNSFRERKRKLGR